MNRLYYGDNLDVLRRHVDDESVDLVYLDPPFNSNANYNVLFAEKDGTQAASQIKAFEDTWKWDEEAARAFEEVVEAGGKVSQAMQAFRTFLGESDMLAYLAMMAPRLVELRRVLKPTGSIYLHCDPTASHYLKMLLDAVFGPSMFRSRLTDTFAGAIKYEVIGEPVSLPDAASLAASDPYQFQWWALGLVGARPVEQKKGADQGIDGRIYFHEGPGKTKQIILSVKAGKLHAPYVRDLRGVLEREKAEIGVLISLEEPTAPMRKEAASAGFYTSPWGKHPRIQIMTVEDLLTGNTINRPPAQASVTFKRAPKASPKTGEQKSMFGGDEDDDPA